MDHRCEHSSSSIQRPPSCWRSSCTSSMVQSMARGRGWRSNERRSSDPHPTSSAPMVRRIEERPRNLEMLRLALAARLRGLLPRRALLGTLRSARRAPTTALSSWRLITAFPGGSRSSRSAPTRCPSVLEQRGQMLAAQILHVVALSDADGDARRVRFPAFVTHHHNGFGHGTLLTRSSRDCSCPSHDGPPTEHGDRSTRPRDRSP